MSGVMPVLLHAFTSAPPASSRLTASTSPPLDALCRAVFFLSSNPPAGAIAANGDNLAANSAVGGVGVEEGGGGSEQAAGEGMPSEGEGRLASFSPPNGLGGDGAV